MLDNTPSVARLRVFSHPGLPALESATLHSLRQSSLLVEPSLARGFDFRVVEQLPRHIRENKV